MTCAEQTLFHTRLCLLACSARMNLQSLVSAIIRACIDGHLVTTKKTAEGSTLCRTSIVALVHVVGLHTVWVRLIV